MASTTAPLATTFTPASTCNLPFISFSHASNIGSWNTHSGTTTILRNGPGCYPEGHLMDNQPVLYSPGVCPRGWTMADVQYLPTSGASRAHCCPSNALLTTGYIVGHCAFPATAPGTLMIGQSSTVGGNWVVALQALTVEWRSMDLAAFSPASAPLGQLPQSASWLTITPAVSSAMEVSSQARKTTPIRVSVTTVRDSPRSATSLSVSLVTSATQGSLSQHKIALLSPDALIGIGVGSAVGGVVVILLLALLWLLRKKAAEANPGQAKCPSTSSGHTGQIGHDCGGQNGRTFSQTGPYEMSVAQNPSELDWKTSTQRVELM